MCSQPTWLLSLDSRSSSLLLMANGLWSTAVIMVCIYPWDILTFKPAYTCMTVFWSSPASFTTLADIHAFHHPGQEFLTTFTFARWPNRVRKILLHHLVTVTLHRCCRNGMRDPPSQFSHGSFWANSQSGCPQSLPTEHSGYVNLSD